MGRSPTEQFALAALSGREQACRSGIRRLTASRALNVRRSGRYAETPELTSA